MTGRKREGGRAARVAARAAGPTGDEKAVRPGFTGGAYKPLTESEMQQVYDTALGLIEEIGMGTPVPEFIDVVTKAGGHLDDDGRLHYPRDLVKRIVEEVAAKSWVWHGFDEDKSIELSDRKVHFGTAGAAVLILDYHTREFRHSQTTDLYDVARLVDTLEHIHFFVRTIVTRDLEKARDVDLNTAYITMMGTSKPQGTSFFRPEHVYEVVDMYDHVMGGPGEFRKRPFVCANNTFVVPPLRFAYESAECMVAQVHTGMPINLLSAGQAGATSPAALAGSLVQALAECLARSHLREPHEPGSPLCDGVVAIRLRPSHRGDDRRLWRRGGAECGRRSNGQLARPAIWRRGRHGRFEAARQPGRLREGHHHHAGRPGRANLVYESAGMLGSLLACSLEALVIDNDMLGSVNRTVRGIEVTEESMSAQVIKDTIEGVGHFLGSEQTLHLMQREYVYPIIGDRNNPDDWKDLGSTNAAERAHEHVKQVLSSHFPSHITREQDDWIRANYPIALAARRGPRARHPLVASATFILEFSCYQRSVKGINRAWDTGYTNPTTSACIARTIAWCSPTASGESGETTVKTSPTRLSPLPGVVAT